MITDNDIKKLKKVFVAKDELKDELRYVKEGIFGAMNKQKKDLLEAMDKQKDEIIEAIADVIRSGVNPMLDDHEERIKKLEKSVVTAP